MAVLTYLRRILGALDHPELVHMILHYLLALPDWASMTPTTPRTPVAASRRMSLMLLNTPEDEEDQMNPSLFSLVDLILSSTTSRNSQTVISALKLITIILGKNHGYAIGTLIKTVDVHHREIHRTLGALNAEMDMYLSLAIGLAGENGVDEAYETHVKDKMRLLETHPCSLKELALPNSPLHNSIHFDSEGRRDVNPHYLIPEDPLFKSLLDLFVTFLANDVETNLALTEAIINLGACAQLRLEGWLCVDPSSYKHSEPLDQESEQLEGTTEDLFKAARQPTWDASATPPLLACLQSVYTQVEILRKDIQNFDEQLSNRKQAFKIHEEISEAVNSVPPKPKTTRPSAELPPGTWTPQIPKYVLDSSATPSRTQSPRGRKEGLAKANGPTSSPAPSKRGSQTLSNSPSRGLSPLPAPQSTQRQTTLMADVISNMNEFAKSEALKRRIKFKKRSESHEVEVITADKPGSDPEDTESASAPGANEDGVIEKEASLGHILTNVVILQEFVLEVVALLQVRASLFNEVKFV